MNTLKATLNRTGMGKRKYKDSNFFHSSLRIILNRVIIFFQVFMLDIFCGRAFRMSETEED